MSSPDHEAYHATVLKQIRCHAHDPDFVAELAEHAVVLVVLWHLDLGPARPVLDACYRRTPRGSEPWDQVVLLRCIVLAALVGEVEPNSLAATLRKSRVLRILAGIAPPEPGSGRGISPGVATFYRFFHRLHDGPAAPAGSPVVRPSEVERRRARTPQPRHKSKSRLKKEKAAAGKGAPGSRKRRKQKEAKAAERRAADEAAEAAVSQATDKLVAELIALREQGQAEDLVTRVNRILMTCGVLESARRGLLGDVDKLIAAGDGSSLVTAANGLGTRTCDCGRTSECDCPRIYTDPDARVGYDSYRKCFFYGYFFYELCAPAGGHDLPLYVRLDPANTSEHARAALAREGLFKMVRDECVGLRIETFVYDAGHDSRADHDHIRSLGAKAVIPLRTPSPAIHPKRPEQPLSERGVPLCKAGAEMASWGTGGEDRPMFVCPVKAKKLESCPLAPEPGWLCQPETKLGPVVNLNTKDDPRLFPEIARNSSTYKRIYKLRTGCERSNSRKKQAHDLERCRHRRQSLWLIRTVFAALCQHAKVWVQGVDARAFVRGLLAEAGVAPA